MLIHQTQYLKKKKKITVSFCLHKPVIHRKLIQLPTEESLSMFPDEILVTNRLSRISQSIKIYIRFS